MIWIAPLLVLALSLQPQPGGLGRISFPTSGSPDARAHFERGVLLLHSFEYRQARAQFQAAQRIDRSFAMAYWGEAMTYNEPIWFAQDADAARAVLKRLPANVPTERERAYVAAVRVLYGHGTKEERDRSYAAAMGRLHERYPDDHEAAAFHALALLGSAHQGRDFRIFMRAAAIAEAVLQDNPDHPGALHYAIHAYDDPVHAPLGLRAARRYAVVAPAAAHALHMPSHIFVALGEWEEAARSNEAAWKASQDRQPIDAGGYHALWWLQYAYLQQGRYADARRVLATMETLAGAHAPPLVVFHLVQMRAMYSVETGQAYDTSVDPTGLGLPTQAAHFYVAGSGALNYGRRQDAEHALASLRSLPSPTTPAQAHDARPHPVDAAAVVIMQHQLAAQLLLADGRSAEALDLMKEATAIEDRTPYEFGPPMPVKPAHELLGEMLLSLGRPDLARVQFELALRRTPRRALSLLGLARAYQEEGNTAGAWEAHTDLKEMWGRADANVLDALTRGMRRP